MKLVFCGTPAFAVPTLKLALRAGYDVPLVVTQPDRPVGREQTLTAPPVKTTAMEEGIPVVQPEKIRNNAEFRAQMEALRPDAILVVAYGRIIPKWMLELPRLGNLNLHASLLPKYRGAAPIQWAIACGETVTGVTTMRIDAGLDTGDMLLKAEMPIAADDTAVTLAPRLSQLGASLLIETLRGFEAGEMQPTKQDDSQATLAPILKKEDGRIDFSLSATEIFNRLRGFQPWPGAFTTFRGKQLTVHAARPGVGLQLEQAEVTVSGDRLLVGCGQRSVLDLMEVQPEGKKRMSARDFANGYRPQPGEMLGR
ncbi:MAG: methionyl-tRNA formyltransferase [Terriglobia bacterium]|nr:methionyl-tRNA formyltransferase [Terriglobia bacterium]